MQNGKFDVSWIINGILGGLVSITSICPGVTPAESFVIGGIGAMVVIFTSILMPKIRIDDPVGAFPVHGAGSHHLISIVSQQIKRKHLGFSHDYQLNFLFDQNFRI